MTFITKMGFYVMFGISCLLVLFLFANSLNTLVDPYGKKSEAVIITIGGGLMAAGIYFAYKIMIDSEKYVQGCGVLGLTWIVVLAVILTGLLFFNGPVRWN